MIKRFLSTFVIAVTAAVGVFAQTNIRYVCNNSDAVKSYADGTTVIGYHVPGAYTNDGMSWAKAKDNIQDAINDLVNNNLSGEVWVANGTYYPTETTESSGGSTLYMSFKIPKGITVRGGFKGMLVRTQIADDVEGTTSVSGTTLTYTKDGATKGTYTIAFAGENSYKEYDASTNPLGRVKITNSTSSVGYYYPYQMVLDGSISASHKQPVFTWNATKHQYDTEFFGNAYHVVTFALNGFDTDGRAKPLGTTAELSAAGGELAKLEGAMVKNGYAYNASTDGHPHNAYGGGVYMVSGACLEDVAVENCVASRDGGGVYLDGGGKCVHVYVADCQAVGTSLSSGYGGGICIEENKQVYPPIVMRSATINCAARYGGGLANKVNNPTYKVTSGSKTYDMRYNEGISAVVVSGCTAITEGGGVYALNGGSFSHMTIARNACYGSGITINGMKTGQSAGFYARNNVLIANSILWGGSINDDTSKSAQYASSRSTSSDKAEIYYCAMNNVGRVDFTGVKATGTVKLSTYNTSALLAAAGATANSEEGYVDFLNPLAAPGYSANAAAMHFRAYEEGSETYNGISYKVQYTSACTNVGVPTTDIDTEGRTPASTDGQKDVFGDLYSSNPTLGAYTSFAIDMSPDVEYTTETTTYATSGKTYNVAYAHVFVDPDTKSEATENVGSAWDKPVKKLADALNKIGEVAGARLPQIEQYGYTITKIIVHVKEGTTTVQGADATGTIRTSSLVIPDLTVTRADGSTFTIPLEILGGYKSSITDDLTQAQTTAAFPARHGYAQAALRNPVLYHTVVTGYVMDDYAYTTPHIFKIENCTGDVTIDGLQVRYANAWSTTLSNTGTTGAAFTITNSPKVTLKNVLIAHCQASNGPAIYETGNSNVKLENCIIHNNTVNVAGITNGVFEKGGIVYVEKGSTITLDHCDVLRNVGYAFYNDGTVTMDNSICYANMTTALDDTNDNSDKAMKTFAGSGTVTSLYGQYNLFDTGSASDTKATAIGTANQEFKFVSGIENKYPSFINPTKNSGVSEGGDATYYGRATSFEPQNTNNGVNAASTGGVAHASTLRDNSWGTDMSANTYRDYGGLPDIGAVESHMSSQYLEDDNANPDGQHEYGTLYYVKDYGNQTTGGDGMSWKNAINGNAYYVEDTGEFLGANPSREVETSETRTVTYKVWEIDEDNATTTPTKGVNYKIRVKGTSNYISLSGTTVSYTTDYNSAHTFTFTSSNNAYYLYDAGNSTYYYPYHTNNWQLSNGYSVKTSSSQTGSQWTISTDGVFSYKSSKALTTGYLYIENGKLTMTSGGSSTALEIIPLVEVEKSKDSTYTTKTTLYGITGLQYAVNKASNAYSLSGVRREVWVAAGTYAKDPETRDGYYFDIDDNTKTNTDESCFIIRDGVDVYGAFPVGGNPCKNERQALLSQYVKQREDKSYDYKIADYETILQPATTTVTIGTTRRVLGQPYANCPAYSSYTNYDGATWDGFTIRNGYIDASKILTAEGNGGAGATVYWNVTLKNCVITNNTNFSPGGNTNSPRADYGYRGGGMVVRGGTVEECYIINNKMYVTESTSSLTQASSGKSAAYGGGLYFNTGTIYNCVVANNYIFDKWADGAGFYIDGAVNCYNNTIVNNKAEGSTRYCGGIGLYTSNSSSSNLQIFNTIVANNIGCSGEKDGGTANVSISNSGGITLTNCITEDITNATTSGATITYKNCVAKTGSNLTSVFSKLGNYGDSFANLDLRLTSGSAAINAGLDAPKLADADGTTVDLSTYTDMDYEDRIQDCTIDIGAFEYNGAYDITPTLSSDGKEAYFFVTQNGRGTASAKNPTNAACYTKLQKVIDAAGRYKYNNPNVRCIVKLAGDPNNTGFQYKPCRTTDQTGTDQDVRIWSIIVPRGVEVWGGYTDAYTSETVNGFTDQTTDGVTTAARDVLNHPTYFTGEYVNKDENATAFAYHVVEFSNNVYDGDGVAYKDGDEDNIKDGKAASTTGDLLTLDAATFGRGIVDGIFITGGQADVNTTTKSNEDKYGGAAIVNEYGHVRNCIIRNNTGDYGGGLAIAKGGLVSGCLIDQNTAKKNGGGVYVLSDEENTNIGITTGGIPHVYTSTIVNNTASVQGGGIFFDNGENGRNAVRVNSSVIWQNHCSDMANVAGDYNSEKPADNAEAAVDYFPFAYTAVQNLRASGENNISIDNENKKGTRFWNHGDSNVTAMAEDLESFSDFGYYLPTTISGLLRVGMTVDDYEALMSADGLSLTDFSGMSRESVANASDVRSYIDMGARAQTKAITSDTDPLMLRVFVAQSEDLDPDAIADLQQLTVAGTTEQQEAIKYYKQEGSSFAYPFQSLQEAIDYIYTKRGCNMTPGGLGVNEPVDNANLLPFEIIMAKGTYYPTEDLMGNANRAFSNTFAIPEGVHIYGGFAVDQLGTGKFYGRYNKAKETPVATYATEKDATMWNSNDITNNIEPIHTDSTGVTLTGLDSYTFVEASTSKMTAVRPRIDVNANSIIEPWEFKNQTYLSGKSVGDDTNGVFHVITFVPDENVVGVLPPKSLDQSADYNKETDATKQKYMSHERGQYSILNGLIITGGSAKDFHQDEDMDEFAKYNYYHGGGMLVDGNRYNDNYNRKDSYSDYNTAHGTTLTETEWTALPSATTSTEYLHTGVTNAVGYRDQIISISQCRFVDNEAGYGGAMSINNTTEVSNSMFENNLAVAGEDKNIVKDGITISINYPGQGGAIFSTHNFDAYNTVFANNEARMDGFSLDGHKFTSWRNPDASTLKTVHGGIGGAIYSGMQGYFHLVNCDIVRNMANLYPAVFTRNPNKYGDDEQKTDGTFTVDKYNQLVNTVAWGNELNATSATNYISNEAYMFAGKLICNYGKKDRGTGEYTMYFGSNCNMPTKQANLDDDTYAETAWFSAYEKNRGMTCKNTVDLRDDQFRPTQHCIPQLTALAVAKSGTYQNCNVEIDSDNSTLEGPNFTNPSKAAGIDGFDESADWSPARLNSMTDQGSGRIVQEITKNSDETYDCTFPTYATATKDKDGNTISGTTIAGYWGTEEYNTRKLYSKETDADYITSGVYTTMAYLASMNFAKTIPLGTTPYMTSVNGNDGEHNLYRISYDPNPTHGATYIDIGAYEYMHTPLKYDTEGDECDILWVSSEEKPDNGLPEGSSWSQPTSDLQRAIETLLSSRNGHRKEIRLMDGIYSPVYTIEGKMSFYIDTKYLNSSVVLPTTGTGDSKTAVQGLGIKSFTIKGGYSKDLNDQYDVDEYPAIIRQKQQTGTSANQWDYLFYIKDATQRYGSTTAYADGNGYGWWLGTSEAGTAAAVGTAPTTIPIQIDGVSFVNNQSSENINGAAVRYADQSFGEDCIQADGATKYIANAPVKANVSVMDADGNKVVDATNADGTAETYKYVEKTNPYKFILSRSTVMNSGDVNKATTTSAAYIGKYGGEALVYNSVFHSNYGNALNAYATKTINNTFALNYGKMVLTDKTGNDTYDGAHSYNSTIYNSVFWKNNNGGSGTTYGDQFNLVASSTKTYDGTVGTDGKIATDDLTTNIQSNAYTGGNSDAVEYETSKSTIISGNKYNVGLSESNTDAVYGPNFINPAESAKTDDEVEARDFKLAPSLRLLNRGDNNTAHDVAMKTSLVTALYNNTTFDSSNSYAVTWGDIYDYEWVTASNTDAGSETRVIAKKSGVIDLGAYEYQSKQNRVLYVDPNKLASGTGLSWASPLGYGNIQAAIDACAVYYKNENQQTYVFVKANSGTNLGQHSGETLTMRNGVAVYGSVVSDYLEDCPKETTQAGDYKYTDADLAKYVSDIKIYHRNGILSPTEGHTRISGINTNGTAFDNTGMTVIDGFDVTAQIDASTDKMAKVTEPVININPKKSDTEYATGGLKMVVHNIAVHGNNYEDGAKNATNAALDNNLININNCLLYEALVYNNKVKDGASVLNLDGFESQDATNGKNYGYAASVTVEGKTTGADGSYGLNNCSASTKTYDKSATYDGTTAANPTSGNLTASHVYNSITNYDEDPTTWKTLSGYCYKQSHQGFNYQLTEVSKYIDCINVGTNGSKNQAAVLGDMPANFSSFIHYWPEISGEYWTQADRDVLGNFRLQTLGTVAGGKYDGNDYSSDGKTAYAPKLDRGACETWDIKQSTLNLFPDFAHDGSVEYIRAGKSFIIDPILKGVVNSAHEPGFCLIEAGGNLYGNGRRVELSYVALQSYIPAAALSMSRNFVMSAPYRVNYNETTEISSSGHGINDGVAVEGIGNVAYDKDGGLVYTKTGSTVYTYDGAGRSATDYEFNTGVTENSDCWKQTTGDVAAARGVLINYTGDITDGIVYRVTSKGTNYEDKVYKEEVNYLDNHVYQAVPLYKYDDSESTKGAADFTDMNDQGWNCIGLPYLVSSYHTYKKVLPNINANPGDNEAYVSLTTKMPSDTGYDTFTGSYAMVNPKTMWLYYNGYVNASGERTTPDGKTDAMAPGGFYPVSSWDITDHWHKAPSSGTEADGDAVYTDPTIWMGEGFFVQNQKFSGNDTLKFYVPVAPTLPIVAKSGAGTAKQSTLNAAEEYCTRYYYMDVVTENKNVISDVMSQTETLTIYAIGHTLHVKGLSGGEDIRIYDAGGALISAATAQAGEYTTTVHSGFIIVAVNNASKKIYVR